MIRLPFPALSQVRGFRGLGFVEIISKTSLQKLSYLVRGQGSLWHE
jgi:hypothetical protein